MSAAGWRAALRLSRRDAWRHKARSLLVMALVGLPIFVIAGVDVLYRTWQLGPVAKLDRQIGQADAWLRWYGTDGIEQEPDASGASWHGLHPRPAPSLAQVRAALPPGSTVIGYQNPTDTLTFYTHDGLASASLVGLDYRAPLARGIVHPVSGRAPRTDTEVAITEQLAADTGLHTGDTLRATDPTRRLSVVGIVRTTLQQRSSTVFAPPGAIPPSKIDANGIGIGTQGWLARTPRPITWPEVQHLNRLGYVTLSRWVYLHPPSGVVPFSSSGGSISTRAIATATLLAGMAVLEVVLLAGPAFAVGTRRRQRGLALLAAVGGGRADLRRSVLADAVVLGAAAGGLAAVAGIGGAALAEPFLAPYVDDMPGAFTVPYLDLAGLVLVSVTTALLAAVTPAIRAGRIDVVATLAGRRGATRSRWRWPVIGAIVTAVGAVVAVGASSAGAVLLGVALVEVGVIACTPALIGFVSHGARWLPPTGRIALRDAGRTRTAAAPAVAAVMAAMIGAMAIGIGAASSHAKAEGMYEPELPQHDTWVSAGGHADDVTAITAALRDAAPHAPLTTVDTIAQVNRVSVSYPGNFDPYAAGTSNSALPQILVASPRDVPALYGRSEPAAAAILASGRAVVGEWAGLAHGSAALRIVRQHGRLQVVRVPAAAVRSRFEPAEIILPPALVKGAGLSAVPAGVLASSSSAFSPAQRQRLAFGLSRTGHAHSALTEYGYQESASWVPFALVGAAAFVAVFAALLATALANVDSVPDLVLLGAVGASPRSRRVLSMARAAVIAGLGCGLGTVAGLVPAAAWVRSLHTAVVVPWSSTALLLVGIPLATAALAGLFTRARLPSERPG